MMAECSEVQALEKISTEVGESQIKITLSSQCIKAQAFLVDKLRKQTERQKELCNLINSNNLKLQAEIKQAELEIKSLIIAHETIKSGNTELKKELLLAKEKKSEIAGRVSNGEKKYEALWLESKERYESIPFVQKLLLASGKIPILEENVVALNKQSHSLKNEIKTKKIYFENMDRNRIIQVADYLINVLPKTTKAIREKYSAINEVSKDIDCILKDQNSLVGLHLNTTCIKPKETFCEEPETTKRFNDSWKDISKNNECDMMKMPRMQFMKADFDALNARLDQIKIMKVEIMNPPSLKRVNPAELVTDFSNKRVKDDEFSIFFNNSKTTNVDTEKDKKDETYASRKLINILDNIKIDKSEAYNMVSKINLDNLKDVVTIGKDKVENNCEGANENETEKIEEIDLTNPTDHVTNPSLLVPPTQFLDLSQARNFSNSQQQVEVIVHMSVTDSGAENMSEALKTSQESINKKRVSFDLPLSIQEITNELNIDDVNGRKDNDDKANETIESQADISLVSDESYTKIKDMILKKHNLDLSPQFIYSKNKKLQSNTKNNVVTSKFFQKDNKNIIFQNENNLENKTNISMDDEKQHSPKSQIENPNEEVINVDQVIASSPKRSQIVKTDRSVTGLLFNHSSQGIPESLNMSISTTGFEEGDNDFPQCIDSSLLLSPKADLPMPMSGENIDVTSQEVPNFLSGLRKTGLSFFGPSTASDAKPDTIGQNKGNNFNFNFGGGDNKSRGGLFSMFR